MKLTFMITTAFATAVLAHPSHVNHHRRHVPKDAVNIVEKRAIHTEWVIETAWITQTEYVDATTTITIKGQPSLANDGSDEADTETRKDAQFFETPAQQDSPPQPTVAADPAPQPVVNPPEHTPEAIIPAPAPAAASPASIPQVVPEAQPQGGSSASNGGSSDLVNGELTWFILGIGACGWNDAGKDESEYYIALSAEVMGERSNDNPYCGRTVTITAPNGASAIATIRDKCGDCAPGHIDGTKKLFTDLFGSLGVGRGAVQWQFN